MEGAEPIVNEQMSVGDVVIGLLAVVGVVVLIVVFIWVCRMVFFKGDDQKDV